MSKPEFVYTIYIASTPERVFAALTDAKMSEQYWHGSSVVSDWKIGSPFAIRMPRHNKEITGEVLEYDPPRRLAYSFLAHDGSDGGKASRVTFELERQRDQVRLTVIHDRFEPGSVALEKISLGWPLILSSLKSYVECGRVLHAPWYENEATTEQAR
ncbi:SRPBCC family protein [Bradyrhizobium septentrionale]|uniref:SRPBCC family protein n=2 Tax=Bradyrhizobium septentrionale TaxID=1404411 RepID=A0ABZ2P3J9_9BRAD|nr:SRPBCC family protein [Bradyrhizobium septentrionale]UGY28815.1 SRPBCC family protein [Bradyrhizobium septentrionale]